MAKCNRANYGRILSLGEWQRWCFKISWFKGRTIWRNSSFEMKLEEIKSKVSSELKQKTIDLRVGISFTLKLRKYFFQRNRNILRSVQGYVINFESIPLIREIFVPLKFSQTIASLLDEAILKLENIMSLKNVKGFRFLNLIITIILIFSRTYEEWICKTF